MKRFKIFGFIILLALFILLLFGSCRKTKALESELSNFEINISARDVGKVGAVFIYNYSQNPQASGSNLLFINGRFTTAGCMYLSFYNNNTLTLYFYRNGVYTTLESVQMTSRLMEFHVVPDNNSLYLACYELKYSTQHAQGLNPAISGIYRTMKFAYNIGEYEFDYLNDIYDNGDLPLVVSDYTPALAFNGLVNCSYISDLEMVNAPQSVNSWVDSQLNSYLTYQNILEDGYDYGYDDAYDYGYSDGYDDGESAGYSDGYDDGESAGYINGWNDGNADGITEGYNQGYQIGYEDGASGETAISPVFRIISDVFGAIGSIMAVELVPHVPLGLFILVPLFFAALGLILWIWRRN